MPYSRGAELVQAFVDGKTMLRCRETGSMEGLLPQCDLEHFDHVIMDLRHLEHTLATVVNGLHEDDHCTDKSFKAIVPTIVPIKVLKPLYRFIHSFIH